MYIQKIGNKKTKKIINTYVYSPSEMNFVYLYISIAFGVDLTLTFLKIRRRTRANWFFSHFSTFASFRAHAANETEIETEK